MKTLVEAAAASETGFTPWKIKVRSAMITDRRQ